MQKKLIVRIAEGLGNQLFMYAHSYALSKKIDYKLLIDDKSAYFKKKDIRYYLLDNLNVSAEKLDTKDLFNTELLNFKRKILKNVDYFFKKKSFLIEKTDNFKKTFFYNYDVKNFATKLYVEGYFESENYFKEFRNDLKKEFSIKNSDKFKNNRYYQNITNNNKVVSICIRQHRHSERVGNKDNILSIDKSNKFTQDTIQYIHRAILICEKKINKPIFYIWSNDFSNLKEYFNDKKFIFVDNDKDKTMTDYYLLNQCRNFIVGPTSFHWWPAWLNYKSENLIICPKNLRASNNIDFWPKEWTSI